MFLMLAQLNQSPVCVTFSVIHHIVLDKAESAWTFPVVHHILLGKADSDWNTRIVHVSLLTCHFADMLSC